MRRGDVILVFIFLIEVLFIYSVVLVSAIQQQELSYIHSSFIF